MKTHVTTTQVKKLFLSILNPSVGVIYSNWVCHRQGLKIPCLTWSYWGLLRSMSSAWTSGLRFQIPQTWLKAKQFSQTSLGRRGLKSSYRKLFAPLDSILYRSGAPYSPPTYRGCRFIWTLPHSRKTMNTWAYLLIVNLRGDQSIFLVAVNTDQLKSCRVIRRGILCSALSGKQPSASLHLVWTLCLWKGLQFQEAWQPPQRSAAHSRQGWLHGSHPVPLLGPQPSLPSPAALHEQAQASQPSCVPPPSLYPSLSPSLSFFLLFCIAVQQ